VLPARLAGIGGDTFLQGEPHAVGGLLECGKAFTHACVGRGRYDAAVRAGARRSSGDHEILVKVPERERVIVQPC
jgi:hypothetical protein